MNTGTIRHALTVLTLSFALALTLVAGAAMQASAADPPLSLSIEADPITIEAGGRTDFSVTLLNSGDFGVRAIRLAFEQMIALGDLPGLAQAPADDLIRAQIGKPPHEFYRDLLPAGSQHLATHLHTVR